MAFMRKSKFRHVFGKALRRDQCYDSIRITKSSWDSTFTAVNPKFVAIITEAAGGGSFLVLPLSKVGRVARDCSLVAGHRAAVLDIAFCPHNDNIIASASEDCSVKVWLIPDGGLVTNMVEPVVDLLAHQRRVGIVVWHPTAHNILLSAGSDNKVFLWNCGTGEPLVEITLPDLILSASFNYNGSRVAVTTKDKMIRVLDPRTGSELKNGKGHQGSKPSQVVYLKNGKIFTTGFSRMSERQYALWDENDMSHSMVMEEIDNSNGVLFPFYDPDTNMIYLCGKGDCSIGYYELTDEDPYVHPLSIYKSPEPQRGIGMMTKRGVNVNQCEIARFYKLQNNGLCEVIPFTVPRKSELYQEDLYPDTADEAPSVSAEDWINGKDADPVLVSLKEGFKSAAKEPVKTLKRVNILDKMPMKTSGGSDSPPSQTPSRGSPTPVSMPTPHRPEPVVQPPAPKPEPVVHHTPAPTPAPTRPLVKKPGSPTPAHSVSAAAATPVAKPIPVVSSQRQSANLSNAVSSNDVPTGLPNFPPNFDALKVQDDIQLLKETVKKLDQCIEGLELRLSALESDDGDGEDNNNDADDDTVDNNGNDDDQNDSPS